MPRSKFDDPNSSLYPPGVPQWVRAQISVDTSSFRFLCEQIPTDSAYVVPEPASLIAKAGDKSKSMFRSWLKYRPILILRLSFPSSMAQPKHGKAWNALLCAEYAALTGGNTPEIRAKETERLRNEMTSFLGNTVGNDDVQIVERLDLTTARSSWYGIPFDRLTDGHFEQILWELAELNFRFEFQALDRRARLGTPFEEEIADEALVACFADQSLAVPSLASANHGILSIYPRERAHYLFAMARVMSKWKPVNPRGHIMQTCQRRWPADKLDELEKEIATIYTQSFYDYFRRAAILPRRLSERAIQALPLTRHLILRLAPVLDSDPTVLINDFLA